MDISVVITALNGRATLSATLDSIAEHLPDAEVIVANGPSADGTSGLVCDHAAVDRLLELSDRNPNVARNAGLAVASGAAVAFIGQGTQIKADWRSTVTAALRSGADAVTGPIHRELGGDVTTETVEETTVGSREVRYFDPGNVIFTRETIEALDGFDERLQVGSARDTAHRMAGMDQTLSWEPKAAVLRARPRPSGHVDPQTSIHAQGYRARGYRMAKNYGPGWQTVNHLVREIVGDGLAETGAVLAGSTPPSVWAGKGRAAITQVLAGVKDGLIARVSDRSPKRNPHGLSARRDRPVSTCEP